MPAEIKEWLGVIAIIVSLAGTLYTVLTRPGKEAGDKAQRVGEETAKDIKAVDKRVSDAIAERDRKIDALEDRVSRIEGELRHLPDRATVHRMELSITEMKGDMKAIVERLTPVAAIADRLQEFLLEQAKVSR